MMPRTTPIYVLLTAIQILPVFGQYNWFGYPTCAQPILQNYAPASCYVAGDVYASNNCLCSDNSFLSSVAVSVYKTCGCADLTATGQTVWTYCTESVVTPALDVAQFVSKGDGGESVCGTPSSSSSSTSSKSITATGAAAAISTPAASSPSGTGSNDGNGSGGGSGNGNGNSGNNDGNTNNYNYGKNAAVHTLSPTLITHGNALSEAVLLTVAWLAWLTH